MLYYLFKYLNKIDFPGAGVFEYISFRALISVIISLIISLFFGKKLILFLKKKQIKETIRDLSLEGQNKKQGTPTMGGLIIISSILIPTILLAKLDNIYIILIIISTILLGIIGFIDDYIKVYKKNKKGLSGKFKIIGQIIVGVIVATTLYFNSDSSILNKENKVQKTITKNELYSAKTTIPFVKKNEFDYSKLITWISKDYKKYTWIVFVFIAVIVIISVSNGANITDGLDGLAAGTCSIIGSALGIFAFVSGNYIFAEYLNIMYLPNTGELVIFISAFVGSCIGFLWHNSYPATIFMGDTGSLTLGGIIAIFAIMIRKELILPILCGIFLIENLSVIIQVTYFKYTKKRFGQGRRILKMAPLHHHYQKKGISESKIVSRFWIIGVMLAVLSIVTLKLR